MRIGIIAAVAMGLQGCVQTAATPMETVQVRGATIGCSEALTQLGDEPGVDIVAGGIGGSAGSAIRISGGVGGVKPASPVQRCQQVLDTVSRIAEAELQKVQLENQRAQVELDLVRARAKVELAAIAAGKTGLEGDGW
jgi:hypothetical protein